MKKELHIGDTIEVRIEKIVPQGLGLSHADGATVFTPFAAVGDVLRVRIERIKGGSFFAEIVEIIKPGTSRIEPRCKYYGKCGGCDFQHLEYKEQLEAKRLMVKDCLERIGRIDLQVPIGTIASPQDFAYRLRAQWHVDAGRKEAGYYRRNSREIIDIENCPILVPELSAELSRIREKLLNGAFSMEKAQVDAAAGEGDISVSSTGLKEKAKDISIRTISGKLSFSALTFFQGNRFLIDRLIDTATGGTGGKIALDLYCGVGLFTLSLARRFERVVGVEENRLAVEFARRNMDEEGLHNVEFFAATVRDFLRRQPIARPDLVLLDPPRAGTERETIDRLLEMAPANISYVACEPAVLARDLKRFLENGYLIESLAVMDLFPQTHHVETVARLRLGS